MSGKKPFCSTFYPREIIIGDDNFRDHCDVTVGGVAMARGWMPRQDDDSGPFRSEFSLPLIPEVEWKERIEEQERTKTRPSDLMRRAGVPCKNQRSIPYCWIFAAVSAYEQMRVQQGERYVALSPASAGGPITGYRAVGGWSTRGLRWIGENGLIPTEKWPDTAIDRRYATPENEALRKSFTCPDWMEARPRNFHELISALLSGLPGACGYNWQSHATVCLDAVVLPSGEVGTRSRNSWGADYGDDGFYVLSGNKKYADDAIFPTAVTPNT